MVNTACPPHFGSFYFSSSSASSEGESFRIWVWDVPKEKRTKRQLLSTLSETQWTAADREFQTIQTGQKSRATQGHKDSTSQRAARREFQT